MLSMSEWELINKIVLLIYSENDSHSMRKSFLENLRGLIDFDVAEFSLVNDSLKLYNSIEVNMINDATPRIAEIYNRCKESYGNESTDYIFKYPESFIASNRTTLLRGDSYQKTKFNTLFLKSINMKHCCTVTLKSDGNLLAELSLYYSADPDFSEKDIYILSQFKEHLANRLAQLHGHNTFCRFSKPQIDFLLSSNLTERELQIAQLIFSDTPNYIIADSLCISSNTLKKHTSNIYKKLNVSSRSQLKQLLSETHN